MTLVAPLLVMLLVFVAVVVHRGVEARLRIDSAAHQAARAASIERTAPAADTAASAAASASLGIGPSCVGLSVRTDTTGFRAGGTVSVTVTCEVDLSGAVLLGVPGRTEVSATAVEPVDTFRSLDQEPR